MKSNIWVVSTFSILIFTACQTRNKSLPDFSDESFLDQPEIDGETFDNVPKIIDENTT